jgi:hypothetical protein
MPTQMDLPRPNLEKETNARLTAAYEAATTDDKARVHDLVRRAVGASYSTATVEFTPGTAAILFHDHNTQNRKWQYTWSLELERRMREGEWDLTNNAIGFSDGGSVIDGQHRFAAQALAGQVLVHTVVFGMLLRAVESIDVNHRRAPATAAAILQHKEIGEATIKASIISKADSYLAKVNDRPATLHSSRQIGRAMIDNEARIEEAIRIGKETSAGLARPTLKVRDAQVLIYILLQSAWPALAVTQHLRHLQVGEDVGENAPTFIAAKILEKESRGERYAFTAKMALAIKVFQLAQQGTKAIKASSLKDVMKPKHFPKPDYPSAADAAA